MKQFLQILFVGSVLFVLLGLYNQQEKVANVDLPANDLEQVFVGDGILAYHHQHSSQQSKINDQDSADQEFLDIREARETVFSNQIRSAFKISRVIHSDIMRALIHMKGLFPHQPSGKEILS